MTYLVGFLLVTGALLLLIAAWGVITLRDALSRQHAATKAGTLALTCIAIGVALQAADAEWTWRLVVLVVFLFITLPVASHLLARAAVRESDGGEAASRAPLIGGADPPAQG